MDTDSSSHDFGRFHPSGTGLLPGEEILWTRRAGFGYWQSCCAVLLVLASLMLIFAAAPVFGITETTPITIGVIICFFILLYWFLRTKRTRYYLTDSRLLEVHGNTISKEIPLEHFAGKPIGQFLESRVSHTANNRPVYTVSIYDPLSEKVMEMKGLDQTSVFSLEKIGQIRECLYCGLNNLAMSNRCKYCGAVL